MISYEVIEEIKYRNDIEDIISGYIPLKRAGSNLTGKCPFHSEKTPSFTVFTGTKSYYCFGCGAGGDVITFIMRIENLDYPDAVKFLADRVGIEVTEEGNRQSAAVKRKRILEMNQAAAKFFYDQLQKSSRAQEYVRKRELSNQLVKHFGIGYAPDDFGMLTKHLLSNGYTQEEVREGFLCSISKKNGRPYDIFRDRLMFPVIDVNGNVVAFGGRRLGNDESTPKYINTSDTPAFKKSRNLFALNFAKNTCSERLLLCEGYMDVVSLHGAGFTNAVASCGTALTDEQARLMSKYTKCVIITYDADEAGQRAADKAFSILGKVGVEAKILKVNNAKDPDEYIKRYGRESFSRLMNDSRSRFEFKFSTICDKNDITTREGTVKAIKETEEFIAQFTSEVERDIYTMQASEKLKVSFQSMKNDVEKIIYRNRRRDRSENEQKMIRASEGYGDRVNPDRIKNVGAASAEDVIIGVLAMYPELISRASAPPISLTADDFFTEFNKKVYSEMLKYGGKFDIGLLGEEFTQDEVSRIVRCTVMRRELKENGIEVIEQCTEKLRSNKGRGTLSLEELLASKRKKK